MGGTDHLGDFAVLRAELAELRRQLHDLSVATPLASASVERGRIRMYAGSQLLIEDGNFTVSGTAEITGTLDGSGTFSWTGPVTFTGTTNLNGPVNIAGATHITGATTNSGDFTVDTSGKIIVKGSNDMTIGAISSGFAGLAFAAGMTLSSNGSNLQLFGGAGGGSVSVSAAIAQLFGPSATARVVAGTTQLAMSFGAKSVVIDSTGTQVTGGLKTDTLSTAGSKLFSMPHPTAPGMLLQHGSTESPVSGIEYWGDSEIGDDGSTIVELPHYFEALAKATGRTTLVTGRGFSPDWTDILDGTFTVTGEPGKRFSWLVKAERFGADFEVELADSDSGALDDHAASE